MGQSDQETLVPSEKSRTESTGCAKRLALVGSVPGGGWRDVTEDLQAKKSVTWVLKDRHVGLGERLACKGISMHKATWGVSEDVRKVTGAGVQDSGGLVRGEAWSQHLHKTNSSKWVFPVIF